MSVVVVDKFHELRYSFAKLDVLWSTLEVVVPFENLFHGTLAMLIACQFVLHLSFVGGIRHDFLFADFPECRTDRNEHGENYILHEIMSLYI